METLKLGKKDFELVDGRLTYKKELDFDGHIEIEGSLGYVLFEKFIKATGHIFAAAGSGIEAGLGIEAGWGIFTLYRGGITAKFLSCLRIAVGFNIKEEQEITAEIRKGQVILGKLIEPKKVKKEASP
jgi:hypothetical protein